MNYERTEENELVKAILYDFYSSLFPNPSKFELSPEYRNRFVYKKDLEEWKRYHKRLKLGIYFLIVILSYFTAVYICKKRYICLFLNKLFCWKDF